MINAISDIVKEVIEQADEAKKEYNDDKEDMVAFGKLIALAEVLTTMKDYFVGDDDLGKMLDFDIDQRYTA